MKTFYISLVKDLLGCYLKVEAEDKNAVRAYLMREYFDVENSIWKLPWCAVYEELPTADHKPPVVITKHEPIYRRA